MPLDSSVSTALAPWLAALALAAVAAAAIGVWMIHHRLGELSRAIGQLARLEDIAVAVKKLAGDRSDLDLRRLEHVLIEIRDAQRRLEDALLRVSQSRASPASSELATAGAPGSLAERATTRLLALGYERVQLVTPLAELDDLGARDGEILVEARRGGVPCKGRVLVRDGRLADVEMKTAYGTFP
jgi:hypothetical protein